MEIEIKLAPARRTTAMTLLEKEGFFISPARRVEMEASYFDTPDRALKASGVSLRLRQENGIGVCCLKYRVSAISRHEFEKRALTIEEGIRALCADSRLPPEIAQLISSADLVCLYSSRFTRTLRLAQWGRSTVEVAFDLGELNQDDRFCAVSELELELKEGDVGDLEAMCAYLQAKYALPLSDSTKAGRASALTQEAFERMGRALVQNMSADDIESAYMMGKLWKKQVGDDIRYYNAEKY